MQLSTLITGARLTAIIQTKLSLNKITGNLNVGALTLSVDDRKLCLDTFETNIAYIPNGIEVTCKLEIDENIFGVSDLTTDDFFNPEMTAEFFISSEDESVEIIPTSIDAELWMGDRKINIPVTQE